MASSVMATSKEAYDMARQMAEEYDMRKQKDKEINLTKEHEAKVAKARGDGVECGISRKVNDMDYGKHEQTVKDMEKKEEEEEWKRKAQEASEWCTLDHVHGPHCQRPRHGCSHDHQKEWQIYEKSTEEKIKAADRFRMEGNEAYRKQNFGLASVHYRKALLQFDYSFADTPAEERSLNKVKIACLLNLAACKVQQEEWEEVLTQCRLALEIDPRSVKAYYRQGQAYLARDDFEKAKDVLMSAYEIEPKNPEVLASLKLLREKIATYKTRNKEVYGAMCSEEARQAEEERQERVKIEEIIEESDETVDPVKEEVVPASKESASSKRRDESASSDDDEAQSVGIARKKPEEGESTLRNRRAPQPPPAAKAKASSLKKQQKSTPADDEDDTGDASTEKLMKMVGLIAAIMGGLSLVLGAALVFGSSE